MLVRYSERRRFVRVPATGPVYWTCGARRGSAELVDISPGGAALRVPLRRAMHVGASIDLEVPIEAGVSWLLARGAVIVRRQPGDDGVCHVGVEFRREVGTPRQIGRAERPHAIGATSRRAARPTAAQRRAGSCNAPVSSETCDRPCDVTWCDRPRAI